MCLGLEGGRSPSGEALREGGVRSVGVMWGHRWLGRCTMCMFRHKCVCFPVWGWVCKCLWGYSQCVYPCMYVYVLIHVSSVHACMYPEGL